MVDLLKRYVTVYGEKRSSMRNYGWYDNDNYGFSEVKSIKK